MDKFAAYVGDYDAGKMGGVEPNGTRLRCCYRDDDQDGNCQVHSAPGILREGWYMSPEGAIIRGYRHNQQMDLYKYASRALHLDIESRAFDICPKPFRSWSNFLPHETPDRIRELNRRLERMEARVNILFRFADKVVTILKWWKLDKR